MKAGSNLNNSDEVDVYLSHKKEDGFGSTTDWSPNSESTKVFRVHGLLMQITR
ncbi:Uncharacterised protein [Weeksella virosa]|uniref:hypothetical protein n=1 Tax=Weeksella virosa TaxID=1014 RepID=UPI000DFCAC68|nr:hypothetical protein [Weeksella virosa]SUP52125.1 Uncharacterised protein [Weeksella virosa]